VDHSELIPTFWTAAEHKVDKVSRATVSVVVGNEVPATVVLERGVAADLVTLQDLEVRAQA